MKYTCPAIFMVYDMWFCEDVIMFTRSIGNANFTPSNLRSYGMVLVAFLFNRSKFVNQPGQIRCIGTCVHVFRIILHCQIDVSSYYDESDACSQHMFNESCHHTQFHSPFHHAN